MNHPIFRITQATLLIAAVATTSVALAGDRERDGKKGRRGPPPQAFEACEGLAEGTACEVQTRRGNVLSGECKVPRRLLQRRAAQIEAEGETPAEGQITITEDTLVCAPDRRKIRRQSELT